MVRTLLCVCLSLVALTFASTEEVKATEPGTSLDIKPDFDLKEIWRAVEETEESLAMLVRNLRDLDEKLQEPGDDETVVRKKRSAWRTRRPRPGRPIRYPIPPFNPRPRPSPTFPRPRPGHRFRRSAWVDPFNNNYRLRRLPLPNSFPSFTRRPTLPRFTYPRFTLPPNRIVPLS